MPTFILILIVLVALATLYVLVQGVIGMAQGRDVTGQRSQSLMRKRVLFQGIAVLLIILFLMVARQGGN